MRQDLYHSLRALRDHERGIRPDPEWVRETRARLLMQVTNSMPTVEAAAKNRKTISAAYPGILSLLRGPVLGILGIIAVIFGGSFASVRAAENALPGDALYSIKLVTEQTRLALERSKIQKVKLKVEFTKRRVEDLKTIIQKDVSKKENRVAQTADILKQDFHTLKEQLADVKSDGGNAEIGEVVQSAQAIDQEVVEAMKTLKENKEDMAPEVKQKIAEAEAQAADTGMHALVALAEASTVQNEEGSSAVSREDIEASVAQHALVTQEAIQNVLDLNGSVSTTSSLSIVPSEGTESVSTSSSGDIANDAQLSLAQVQTLIEEHRMVEAVDLLKEVSAKSFLAQAQAQKELLSPAGDVSTSSASSTSTEPVSTNSQTSSTEP